VATVDLRARFVGSGVTGTIDIPPALSWLDRQALASTAEATRSVARSLGALGGDVALSIAAAGAGIERAIRHLEDELGLHLANQTALLERQWDALESIDAALRHPAKVRASERLADAAKLLRALRFQRALPLAEEAISDDPLNPVAFSTAGWALLGLGRLDEARGMFTEAAVAAESRPQRAELTRHASRIRFALGERDEAVEALQRVLDDQVGSAEQAACAFDLAVFQAGVAPDQAAAALVTAIDIDLRYALLALADPFIAAYPELRALVTDRVREAEAAFAAESALLARRVAAITEELSELGVDGDGATLAVRQLRDELTDVAAEGPSDDATDVQLAYVRERLNTLEECRAAVLNEAEIARRENEFAPRIEEATQAVARREQELLAEEQALDDESNRYFAEMHAIVNSRKRHKKRREEEQFRAQWQAAVQRLRAMREDHRSDPRLLELTARRHALEMERRNVPGESDYWTRWTRLLDEAREYARQSDVVDAANAAAVPSEAVAAAHRVGFRDDPVGVAAMAKRSERLGIRLRLARRRYFP
jgi:tetratricopeptide (TPR) repeat protein